MAKYYYDKHAVEYVWNDNAPWELAGNVAETLHGEFKSYWHETGLLGNTYAGSSKFMQDEPAITGINGYTIDYTKKGNEIHGSV